MTKIKLSFLLGFLDWLLPFAVSFIIFPLRKNNYFLFESIMSVLVVISAVWLAKIYFGQGDGNSSLKNGIWIGILWLIINLVIDFLLFLPKSPMQMTLSLYISQIGVKYLSIPVITIGFSLLNKNN